MRTKFIFNIAILCLVLSACSFNKKLEDVELSDSYSEKVNNYVKKVNSLSKSPFSNFFEGGLSPNIILLDQERNCIVSNKNTKTSKFYKHKDFYAASLAPIFKNSQGVLALDDVKWIVVPTNLVTYSVNNENFVKHIVRSWNVSNGRNVPDPKTTKEIFADSSFQELITLELKALNAALISRTGTMMKRNIRNALVLRKYRNQKFPKYMPVLEEVELTIGLENEACLLYNNFSFGEKRVYLVEKFKKLPQGKSFLFENWSENSLSVYSLFLSLEKPDWMLSIKKGFSFNQLMFSMHKVEDKKIKDDYFARLRCIYKK
ncbi:MAG: hypothetical protein ACEPOW_06735 [Bacteroidales bacterium]